MAEHRRKYFTLSLVDERTLERKWAIHLTRAGVFAVSGLAVILLLVIYSCLIWYTPLRGLLPGNDENVREQWVQEAVRVDSLMSVMDVQQQYLTTLQQVLAGEVAQDTIQSLDSLQIIMREQLLEAKSQVTADFIAQYEQKEKDNLMLFDVQGQVPTLTFFRPVNGVVVESWSDVEQRYGIGIRTGGGETVQAVLGGTVVESHLEINNTYSLSILHEGYISLYRNLSRVLKHAGDNVSAGEAVALTAADEDMEFELWQNGRSINPEDVILF